ncbi:MAG: hypothetical protein AAFX87_07415 [Bacteroidota bacterium]
MKVSLITMLLLLPIMVNAQKKGIPEDIFSSPVSLILSMSEEEYERIATEIGAQVEHLGVKVKHTIHVPVNPTRQAEVADERMAEIINEGTKYTVGYGSFLFDGKTQHILFITDSKVYNPNTTKAKLKYSIIADDMEELFTQFGKPFTS